MQSNDLKKKIKKGKQSMKTYFRSLLYMGIFAAITIIVFDFLLCNILFTVCRGLFGDFAAFPYQILLIIGMSTIQIVSWRIFKSREMGEEKRNYLKSIEGQPYDKSATVKQMLHDPTHRAVLLAALTVILLETLTVTFHPLSFLVQVVAFWLTESLLYVRHRRRWAEDRLRQ